MNLRPTTVWPHWRCELHIFCRGDCTGAGWQKKKKEIRYHLLTQCLCVVIIVTHCVSLAPLMCLEMFHIWRWIPTHHPAQTTAQKNDLAAADRAPCWWKPCRSSSASARADWCCGWLWKTTHREDSVWRNPLVSNELCRRSGLIRCCVVLNCVLTYWVDQQPLEQLFVTLEGSVEAPWRQTIWIIHRVFFSMRIISHFWQM